MAVVPAVLAVLVVLAAQGVQVELVQRSMPSMSLATSFLVPREI